MRLALIALLLFPAPAFAHVSVLPETSRPGETVDLMFRVPNERDDAATVRVDVFLPPGVPAEIAPHAGWSNVALPSGEVRWTADEGVSIGPGRTVDFKVRLGPLPRQERIVFKSLQHYADGQVVRWIQSSGPDDERPAAVLELAARTSGESGTSPAVYGAIAAGLLALGGAVLFLRRR